MGGVLRLLARVPGVREREREERDYSAVWGEKICAAPNGSEGSRDSSNREER